ncbi:predicted protein [Phaeodactylum tricornutum CCAP 1055/1]|uniref:Domain of unknown function at the cortex 1 domain-containing protein n=2 Tax=Phaeodactylum tricornutum TaxID=2850 RepID=B7GCJ8_PHATC|nr:predicted protein [Phaeodactylum tricornutum CCAP 1055/1]EEC43558.1 predicted protein [Phaeodactylum tricornutum CCAP 1055/1]|eukprot:XP_002184822.1 predicted protein [Phaeodactylum tricornutum CCAP 1055/1]
MKALIRKRIMWSKRTATTEQKASASLSFASLSALPSLRDRKEATVSTPNTSIGSVGEEEAWTSKRSFRLFGRRNKRKLSPQSRSAPSSIPRTTRKIEAFSNETNSVHSRFLSQIRRRACSTLNNKGRNGLISKTHDLRDPGQCKALTTPRETTRLKCSREIDVLSNCTGLAKASQSESNSFLHEASAFDDAARAGGEELLVDVPVSNGYSVMASLQHLYCEYLCGGSNSEREHSFDTQSVYDLITSYLGTAQSQEQLYAGRAKRLLENPAVLENFERVFERHLKAGLAAKLMEEDEGELEQSGPQSSLAAPSQLPQSLLRSRFFTYKAGSKHHTPRQSLRKPRKVQHHVSLHRINAVNEAASSVTAPVAQATKGHPATCHCQKHTAPIVPPQLWPQGQLLMRPTPGSGVRIRGIRFAKATSSSYLWQASDYPSGQSPVTWPQALQDHWKEANVHISATAMPEGHDELLQRLQSYRMCPNCMILPVNNGNEPDGESLVTDFESDLFVGTMLVRLRHTQGTTPEPYNDQIGYFANVKRRYQVVMRGRFKQSIPWTRCVAGLELTRKTARLPAKCVVKGAMKVISFLAPQLDAQLEGSHPHSLTPLGSTAQSLRVQRNTPSSIENNYDEFDLEAKLEEPTRDEETLLGKASTASSTTSRARFRKKGFDKVFGSKEASLQTNPEDIYTFEFLQHLFNFQEFSIELSSLFGSIHLQDCLDGQPLQIVAKHKDSNNTRLWSFDVWHECLYREAVAFDERNCD